MRQIDITIQQGATFNYAYKLAENDYIYKPITGLLSKSPVRLRVENHGLKDQWPVMIDCVKTPSELNTKYPVIATVIDDSTLEINTKTVCCSRGLSGDATLSYCKPYDLTGFTAKATIRPSIYSEEIFYQFDNIIIDPQNALINLQIPAHITETFNWSFAVYDIKVISPNGEVIALIDTSKVIVIKKATR